MQNFSASPREMAASLWRNKGLIRNLVHREVVGRYKGSMLGIFWSLVTPVYAGGLHLCLQRRFQGHLG